MSQWTMNGWHGDFNTQNGVQDGTMLGTQVDTGPNYVVTSGWGHGGGGGFLGTLLFIGLMIFLFRNLLMRGAFMAGRGGWGHGHGPWGGPGRGRGRRPDGGGGFDFGREFFGRDVAMDIVRERLARSEIKPEEFEVIRRGLEGERRPRYGAEGSAMEVLRARFARGEIGAEEFEMIRRALED